MTFFVFPDLSHLDPSLGRALVRWLYTGDLDLSSASSDPDAFLLSLMRASNALRLGDLLRACEDALLASVGVRNCVRFYATADEIGAEGLKAHCSELISTHWVRDIFSFSLITQQSWNFMTVFTCKKCKE